MARRTDEQGKSGQVALNRFEHSDQPRIVIVGAGAAGLAAAQHLIVNGFTNFVILEALDRVGGRVWTVTSENGRLEMGAQFLHGKDVFSDIAEQNKIVRDVTQYDGLLVNPMIQLGSGGAFLAEEEFEITSYLRELFDETYTAITDIVANCKFAQATVSDNDNLGYLMEEQFGLFLESQVGDTVEVQNYRRSVFGWLLRSHCIDNACISMNEVSISEYAKYGGGLINLPLTVPMSTALGLCVPQVPRRKVYLNTPVKQIRFRRQLVHPVQIVCENGTILQADHCIVTSSLGFLKEHVDTFFKPALSAQETTAIRKAGYGTVDKIFLRFDHPFWEEKFGTSVEGFQLLFTETVSFQEDKSWYKGLMGFDVSRTMPNTLVGWIAGDDAEKMELCTDEEVHDICDALLKKFVKGVDVPKPLEVIRPNWYSNPYIRGSYSYAAFDQEEYIEVLAQPTWLYKSQGRPLLELPGLMFAGEVTHASLFSTIPGALESGRREAERIIVLYTKS